MNLKILYLLAMMAMLAPQINGRAVDLDQDNSLSASSSSTVPRMSRPNFVKITSPPPVQITQVRGSTIELECEVMGSPTPTVQWVHGSGQTADVSHQNLKRSIKAKALIDFFLLPSPFYPPVGRCHHEHH